MYTVLLASHLENLARHKTIQYALRSVAEGLQKPDKVMISYSGIKADEEIWKVILQDIQVLIIHHNEKQMQFRHYYHLEPFVKDDDVVMFLDDDDLYHKEKIATTVKYFNNENVKVLQHNWCQFDDPFDHMFQSKNTEQATKNISKTNMNPEHWCLAIRGVLFKIFFSDKIPNSSENFEEILQTFKGATDMFFSIYNTTEENVTKINVVLYYHRATWTAKDHI